MSEQVAEKSQIILPKNFKKHLVEVISPIQSTDYIDMGGRTFPIQVLPIGMEKKIIRLSEVFSDPEKYDELITRASGELCRFHYHELDLSWPKNNCNRKEMELIYLEHLGKLAFNDSVIGVVDRIIDLIDWAPPDEKRKVESEKYLQARIFAPIILYINCIEGKTINYIFDTMTRGLLEIIKLNNMLNNDRLRAFGTKEVSEDQKISDKMSKAKTMEDYIEGFTSQGVDIGNLFN